MSHMKTISVRELQHGLAAVLARVARGDRLTITRRGKIVERIVPPAAIATPIRWPDSLERMRLHFPEGPAPGAPPSALIASDRYERS
jgi:prevent-host-death family protein